MPPREPPPPRVFLSTHWSKVNAAGKGDEAALDALLRRYRPALMNYVRAKFHLAESDAEDVVHGFVAECILKKNLVARADPAQGKFRNLLLTSLDRYYFNLVRAANTQSRRPPGGFLTGEDARSIEVPGPPPDPGLVFDAVWLAQVMKETCAHMRQGCLAAGRADIWGVFEGRVLRPCLRQVPATPYTELVERFAFLSPIQAANVQTTARRKFLSTLRSTVAAYARNEAETDQLLTELRHLLAQPDAWSGLTWCIEEEDDA